MQPIRKRHWFEIICNTFGKHFFKIPVSGKIIEDLSKKLKFCDLKIEPATVISTCVIMGIIGGVVGIFFFILGFEIYGMIILGIGVCLSIYFFYYPSILTKYYRIQASSELVLSVLYMVVSLRLVPNLENAIKFAAKNLSGPVGRDLKMMMWGLSTGKYLNPDKLLDEFAGKWKEENIEFYQSIDMIKTSMYEKGEKREKTLDESINVLLRGNMERMKDYTTQLKIPLMIITMLGITLPVLTVIMFPIITIFLAETIKPIMLVLFYNIILPVMVYYVMSDVLRSMPIQFRVTDISLHPNAHPTGQYIITLGERKIRVPLFLVAIFVGALIIGSGLFVISLSADEPITLAKLFGGITILWGIASILIVYSYFSYHKNIEIRNEIEEIENEFDEGLFQLGHVLYTGQPIETSLEKVSTSMRGSRMEKMFRNALTNIRRFGFTLRKAFFDKKVGVVNYYPSQMIRSILRVIVDTIEKGVSGAAKTMISIAEYLKGMHSVEEHGKEILEETTSNMRFMLSILAPITCGIVVGMATIMVMILAQIVSILSSITGLSSTIPSLSSPGLIESIVDFKNILPAEIFLIIVGVYMIEIIVLLSIFLSTLEHGGDPLDKYRLIAYGTSLGTSIFTFSILLIYFIFGGILSIVWSV